MKIRKEESGQVLVMTALTMVLMLGFVGLAVDVGLLFHARRNLQIAADAAATAGALYESYGQDPTAPAIAAALRNGVNNGVNGGVVTIHMPPADGPDIGRPGFVEAIVSTQNPTVFMNMFGFGSVRVAARAVASAVSGRACFWLMNTTGTDFDIQGSGTITGSDGNQACGIYVNSSSPDSIVVKGQGNYVNTQFVGTVATSWTQSGNSNTTPTPVTTGVPGQQLPADLQLSLPTPNPADCITPPYSTTTKAKNGYQKNETYIIPTSLPAPSSSAGVCISSPSGTGILLQGTAGAPLVLQPGLYVFTGDVALGNYVQGQGITLDLDTGNLGVAATTNVDLYAPCDPSLPQNSGFPCTDAGSSPGAFNGVLLAAPPTNTSQWTLQWGAAGGGGSTCQTVSATSAAGLGFYGIIDAPGVNLNLQDAGGYALVSGIVAGSLTQQTGSICVTNYASVIDGSPLRTITLVE